MAEEEKKSVASGSDQKDSKSDGGDSIDKTKPIDPKAHENMKSDMFKYKDKSRELQEELDNIKLAQEEAKDEDLKTQKKYEELYTKKDQELKDYISKSQQKDIRNALKVESLKQGIQDPDDVKLIDGSEVSYDSATGDINGVEEAVKKMKEKKPYLFGKTAGSKDPKVGTESGQPSLQSDAVTKYEQLLADEKLLKKFKVDHPAQYSALKKDYYIRQNR